MGATARVAEWIVNTSYEDIPAAAIKKAEESCFDLIGCILAGAAEDFGAIILNYASKMGGTAEATVMPQGNRLPAAQATLVNGTYGHILDMDDTGGFGHPTVAIFPALLALGEKMGVTGKDLMEAFVVGFEVGTAVCVGGYHDTFSGFNQMKRVFHSTPVFGRIAATAASAKLLKLNAQQTRWAIGMAASMASGLNGNYGAMTKSLHAGLAGRDGILAAELAKEGWTAIEDSLEHPLGFVAAFFGDDRTNPDVIGRDLGNPFLIQERIGLKRFPCCGGSHSALEGFLSLMRDHNIQYDDVHWVDVGNISYLSPVMIYREVENPLQGKFSMHYTIATALLNGRVDVNAFQHKTFQDPRMKEAMAKVRLNVRAKWDLGGVSRDPGGNPIHIHLKDGRTLSRTVSGSERPGSAMNPFSRDELELKFRANAALSLPPDKVEEAIRVWGSIGEIQDLGQAVRVLLS